MSVPHRHYDSGVTEERLYEMQWHALIARCDANVCLSVCQPKFRNPARLRTSRSRRMSRLQSNGFLFVSTNT